MLEIPDNATVDTLVPPLQGWANQEMGGKGWSYLRGTEILFRAAAGVTISMGANMTTGNTPGYLKYLRMGPHVDLHFVLGLTPSGATATISILLQTFGVVGRSHAVGYDSSGNALSVSLGTPLETISVSTLDPFKVAVLHFEKLDGTDFPGSAFTVRGSVRAELATYHAAGRA